MNEKYNEYLSNMPKDIALERQERKRLLVRYSYKEGMKEGIKRFAWWKDGVQYVGTTGKTLKEALKEVDEEFKSKGEEETMKL